MNKAITRISQLSAEEYLNFFCVDFLEKIKENPTEKEIKLLEDSIKESLPRLLDSLDMKKEN